MAVGLAAGLFGIWMLATYLLEGRIRTFLRPEAAAARLVYAVVANVGIGTIGAALVIRAALRGAATAAPAAYGLADPRRLLTMVILGMLLGGLVLAVQRLPSRHPVVLLNAFAQVLVVSIAEVVVCWAVLGATVRNALGPGIVPLGLAVLLAALAFGFYHFAHSPPFNTWRMVLLLSGVGLATGAFFFLGGDLYGTILFHNAFALRGVTEALARADRLGTYARPQAPLLATAAMALVVLVGVDVLLMRPGTAW